jgi:hypothetical protein
MQVLVHEFEVYFWLKMNGNSRGGYLTDTAGWEPEDVLHQLVTSRV